MSFYVLERDKLMKFIGRRLKVGIGKEAVRGTGVAPTHWLNCLSFNHADKVNKARLEGILGNITGGNQSLVTRKWAEGDMEVELGDKSFGLILLALLGTVSSAVEETTAYKHTFSLQDDNQHDSLSIQTDDPIGDLIFELSMIDNLTLTITPDDVVKYSVTFKSKNSAGSVVTSSYAGENRFLGRYLTFKLGALTGNLNAASGISLKTLTINFAKNTELDNVLGTVQPEDILNKLFSISGDLELNYEDRTWRDYMLNGDYKALRIDLVNSDVTIGASSHPTFRIDLSRCDFDAWEPQYPINDISTQKITFTALYDFVNSNMINDCYLINTDVSC